MRRPRIWKRDVPLQGFIDWLARESFKPGDACEMTITCKDAQYCVMDCRTVQTPPEKFQAPDTGHPEGPSIDPKSELGSAAAQPIEDWAPWPNSYNPNSTR